MLALQIATHGAVMPALQPALQLRGGMSLGGVDEQQIATGLTALLDSSVSVGSAAPSAPTSPAAAVV